MKTNTKLKIKINPLDCPDKLHLDAQIRFPSQVYQNKKKKKAKHPKKDFEKLFD